MKRSGENRFLLSSKTKIRTKTVRLRTTTDNEARIFFQEQSPEKPIKPINSFSVVSLIPIIYRLQANNCTINNRQKMNMKQQTSDSKNNNDNNYKHHRRRKRSGMLRSKYVASPSLPDIILFVMMIIMMMLMSVDGISTFPADSSPANEAAASFEQAQPLVYLHESGSGDGYPRPVQYNRDSSSSSSSMSPSLIAAKCWNNYENDNDCKQLNVITGPSGGDTSSQSSFPQQQGDEHSQEDDSLITPIVIFESSSTYEPADNSNNNNNYHYNNNANGLAIDSPNVQRPDTYGAATPSSIFSTESSYQRPASNNNNNNYQNNYFQRPSINNPSNSNNNVVLARHRTPPASKEEIFITTTTTTTTNPSSIYRPFNPTNHYNDQSPTQPTTSVYVATPQPGSDSGSNRRKMQKTTTEGRKCRDENDADCDEPEQDNGEIDDDRESDNANDADDGDDQLPSSPSSSGGDKLKPQDFDQQGTTFESGSGEAPGDDNEDTGDDDDDGDDGSEENLDSSGNFDNSQGSPSTPRYIEVSSASPPIDSGDSSLMIDPSTATTTTSATPTTARVTTTTTTTQQGAQIEVVVHPTLPPSFPTTSTTTTTTTTSATTLASSAITDDTGSSTASTLMPDDTFKSIPVFPSSNEPNSNEIDSPSSSGSVGKQNQNKAGSDNSNNINGDGDSSTGSTDSSNNEPPIDLATFRPIPMMPQVEQPMRLDLSSSSFKNNSSNQGAQAQSSSAGGGAGGSSDGSKLPDRYRFEPGVTSAPAFKFDNAWRAQPVRAPNLQQSSSAADSWQSRQEQHQRQRAKFANEQQAQQLSGTSASVASIAGASGSGGSSSQLMNRSRTESAEMLPTLLLYASISILFAMAVISFIVAFSMYRQKTARQRALLHKSQLLGAGQMVSSMSHASQLMPANNNNSNNYNGMPPAPPQQPGLLTTYGPGKGLQLQNKITTSIVRGSTQDSGDNLPLDGDLEQAANSNSSDNSNLQNNSQDREQLDQRGTTILGAKGTVAANSWSTTEDRTTGSSSGGSQERADSQQTVQQQQQHQQQQQQQQKYHHQQSPGVRQLQQQQQFNNSLSDGRQNSSSISESQESQDGTVVSIGCQQQQQPVQPYQPKRPVASGGMVYPTSQQPHMQEHQLMMHPQQPGYPQPAQQMLYNQPVPLEDGGGVAGVGPIPPVKRPTPSFHQNQMMAPSQSEDSFQQHQQQHQRQPMMRPQLERDCAIDQQQGPPIQMASPNPRGPPVIDYSVNGSAHHNGYTPNGFNQHATRFSNVGGSPLAFHQPGGGGGGGQQPAVGSAPLGGRASSMDYAPFDGPPVNQARVAMNPLATMSRRPYQPGLNRNIYSEDSSSLMTASPSLARTSSSSSFAFNNQHHPQQFSLDRTIEAKPMIDPTTGRLFNDYSQINQANKPPPIVGRKNPGEAWYV